MPRVPPAPSRADLACVVISLRALVGDQFARGRLRARGPIRALPLVPLGAAAYAAGALAAGSPGDGEAG